MSLLFPRLAYAPVRCSPARREVAPLFSLFDDAFAEVQRASRKARKQWNPRFDIKETKESYQVDAEVPGVDPNDVSVEFIDEHTLSIKGRSERHTDKRNKAETVEAAPTQEATSTPTSDTASVKSHQATVEDEEPANASAAQETSEVAQPAETEKPKEVAKTEEKLQEQYWFSERRVGSFERQFAFPSRVDQEHVKASLKNGLLSIIVPKAAAPESRRITIE